MKLKKYIRKALNVVLIYAISGIIIFAMSERVKWLNQQDRLEKGCSIAAKINK